MEHISDFEIIRELGRGGMGVVYEALERPLQRRVALKLLNPARTQQPDAEERFLKEARNIAQLSHPSIIKIYRAGVDDGRYFLALEYVEGRPLDNVLACERLTPAQNLAILRDVAEALAHAHQRGIVHRDVKPGNVFVRPDGRAVLGDFGLAKDLDPSVSSLTAEGVVVGTPAYMSPEQALSQEPTPATDVYALGVLAFEMISGRVPFTADSAVSMLMKQIHEPPPPLVDLAPPGVPASLIELVQQMLEKTPARRPADGLVVSQRLAAVSLAGASSQASTIIEGVAPDEQTGSRLEELELTVACFKWLDFAKETCQDLLPARVAFLLESWYRLARQSVHQHGGVIDRYVGGKITALFGYPQRHADHAQRAFQAARALQDALQNFNRTHDLELKMSVGIACGPALVGRIAGDESKTSVQGDLMGDMNTMARTVELPAPIRLNRAAYRRVAQSGRFTRHEVQRSRKTLEVWVEEAEQIGGGN
jgi:serine/threonine protein kinase